MISTHADNDNDAINLYAGDYVSITTNSGNIRYGIIDMDIKAGKHRVNLLHYLIPHRIDGPAVEWASGHYSWAIDGIWLTYFKEFQIAGNLSDTDMMIL